MVEPLSLTAVPRTVRSHQVKIHMATWPLVDALRTMVRPLAARRPGEAVPPVVRAQATKLLAATRRVLGQEPGMGRLFDLGDAPDWATLLSQLEFAMVGFQAFRRRYAAFDNELGEHVWHDQAWLSFMHDKRE